MRSLLVTGGAGFIGSNYVNSLDYNNERIYICDYLKDNDQWVNLKNVNVEEVISPNNLSKWLKNNINIDGIIHMGAISSTTEKNADLLLSSNFEFSKLLWRYACNNSIPFVYASSAAVYGNGENGYNDSDELTQKLNPLNAYGWSKLLFDKWVLKENKLKNRPPIWAGLRFFNVYGPREKHKGEMRSLVTKSFDNIKDLNTVISLFKSYKSEYKDGDQKRDFVYVKDCIEIIEWFSNGYGQNGIFNVGSGKASTWNSLANNVYSCMGVKSNIKYIEIPNNIKDQYQYFTEADISKLEASGWNKQFHDLSSGISDYYINFIK